MMKISSRTPQIAINIPVVKPFAFLIRAAPASFRPFFSSVPVRIIKMMVINWLRFATKVVPTEVSRSTTLIPPHTAVTMADTTMMAIGSSFSAKPMITTTTPSKLNITTPLVKFGFEDFPQNEKRIVTFHYLLTIHTIQRNIRFFNKLK